jgi:hypothetical protein
MDGSLELAPPSSSQSDSPGSEVQRAAKLTAVPQWFDSPYIAMAANLTAVPQWFDGPLAHLLDRDDVVWALSFVMVAFGLCTTALLAMSAVCVQDTHDDKEYWLAAFGLIQFWIMNVFILHSMRKVWRPLSHGGGAITVLEPPGVQITLRQMRNLDRRWRYCWILGFVGAAPFFVLFGVAFDQILTVLEDSDLEDAFRSVNLTGLGFPGSHIVDWVPSCGGAGITISAARVFLRLNQVLEFAMTFVYGPLLASLLCCTAYASGIAQSEIYQLCRQLGTAANLDDPAWEETVRQPALRLAQRTMPALNLLTGPIGLFVVGHFTIVLCFVPFTLKHPGAEGGDGDIIPGISDTMNSFKCNFFGLCES